MITWLFFYGTHTSENNSKRTFISEMYINNCHLMCNRVQNLRGKSYVGVFYSIKLDFPVINKCDAEEEGTTYSIVVRNTENYFQILKKLLSMFKFHFGLIYSFREGPNGFDLDLWYIQIIIKKTCWKVIAIFGDFWFHPSSITAYPALRVTAGLGSPWRSC